MVERAVQNRIAPLDGLRTVAVLGVAWAHVWSFGCGAPALRIPLVHLDINQVLAGFGTGVDLFFVISGFCMYLMYASRYPEFRWADFGQFLAGRFRRIAPAFYAAALFWFVYVAITEPTIPWSTALTHVTFTYMLVPGGRLLAAPFWSLSTEWQFYLLLPPTMLAARRFGFWRTLAASAGLSLLCGAAAPHTTFFETIAWSFQIPARFLQFALGIGLARMYLDRARIPRILLGPSGFFLGIVVMYAGRTLLTQWVIVHAGVLVSPLRAVGSAVIALGYAAMVASALFSETLVSKVLTSRPFMILGRWSYGFYLWHWGPAVWIGAWLAAHTTLAGWAPAVAFVLTVGVTVPLAGLSYHWLEAPYFKKRSSKAASALAST